MWIGIWSGPVLAGAWDSLKADPGLTIRAYLGVAAAQNALGRLYFRGVEVPQSDSSAFAWWQKSALRDDADAQTNLGALYDLGRGVESDKAQAEAWWQRAAAQGNIAAQINLRVMADIGSGLPVDDSAAAAWYLTAARKGDSGNPAVGC